MNPTHASSRGTARPVRRGLIQAAHDRLNVARSSGDAGVSLIEVVVAMVVLAITSMAVLSVLLNATGVSKAARQRVAASNLASREAEIARNIFNTSSTDALALANAGTAVNPSPLSGSGDSVVDGIPYRIERNVQWLPIGNGASACDGGSLVQYPSLRVQISVTWPNMGQALPVRADTLLTPPKDTLGGSTLSFLAVRVRAADGTGKDGVVVGATGPGGSFTQTTDSSGCAVLQVGTPGTYTVRLNTPGYVDKDGNTVSTKTSVVSSGSLARQEMTYDEAGVMLITLAAPAGFALPTPLPAVNYIKPNVTPASAARVTVPSATTSTSVTGLWPSPDAYTVYAGSCADADPAGTPTSGSRGPGTTIAPGGSGTATATLAPVEVTVRTLALGAISGATVKATSRTSCTGTDSVLTLGTTNASGVVNGSLPYGSWTITATRTGFSFPALGTAVDTRATGTTTATVTSL